jgi:alpha-1,3-glucosyltransferase
VSVHCLLMVALGTHARQDKRLYLKCIRHSYTIELVHKVFWTMAKEERTADGRGALAPSRFAWCCLIAAAVAVRCAVAALPYSGMNQPPKFGDYEAQRHWMELTLHTPLREWYVQSPHNDLLYWGLDYPPLTAYHSRICAQLLHIYEPESVALLSSRGYESPSSKLLMRLTVVITDALILFPAAVVSSRLLWAQSSVWAVFSGTASLLLNPALIIIDHGHFQYNGVMAAFTVLSVALLYAGHVGRAAAAAAAAVLFKQMALLLGPYWLAAGFSLVVRIWRRQGRAAACRAVLRAAAGAAAVLAAALLPFHFTGTLHNVFSRVFPVSRGLYEDKVATVWCAVSPLLKLQVRHPLCPFAPRCWPVTARSRLLSPSNLFRH